jgi:ketosteroid isomerase-like protein
MPSENVSIIHTMFESFNRGDVAGALAHVDPEIEAEPSSSFPDVAIFRGHQGVLDFFATFFEAWEEYHAEPKEFIEGGGGDILVVVRQRARGRGSGVEFESDMYQVWKMRDRKVVRMRVYENKAEALQAIGGTERGSVT